MSRILGLDLGTNSIGWALVDSISKKIAAGVTTFQKGVTVKKDGSREEPLNVEKRKARQQRRQVFYKDFRLTKMTEVLARFKMFPYLKVLDNEQKHQEILIELKKLFNLSDQQLKNLKLSKYKDKYQLNSRIVKLLLQMGILEKSPSDITPHWENCSDTIEQLIEHLVAFISLDPYKLRSEALTRNTTHIEFGRILYQIGKRRGFKSSRKIKNKDDEEKITLIKKSFKKNDKKKNWEEEIRIIQELHQDKCEIVEDTDEKITVSFPKKLSDFFLKIDTTQKAIEQYITLGNYLYYKNSHEERIRKETRADRSMYIDEFNLLWEKHANRLGLECLSGEFRNKKKVKTEILLKEFLGDKRKGILFYQRPLKSQKHLVAKCTFASKSIRIRNTEDQIIKDEKGNEKERRVGNSRCLISHPLFERFRALQQINNLKVKRLGKWETLNEDERRRLLTLFTSGCNEIGKVAITKVLKELNISKEQLKGASEGDVEAWEENENTKKKKEASFSGNYTLYKIGSLFGDRWNTSNRWPENTLTRITSHCIRRLGGEAVIHSPSFRKKSKEDRKKIIIETGTSAWDSKEQNEKDNLVISAIQEEIWHAFSFYEDNDPLFEKLNHDFGLEEDKKEEMKKIILKPGYGSFCLKTIKKFLPFMEKGIKQTDAVFLANIDDVWGKEKWDEIKPEKKENISQNISELILKNQNKRTEANLLNSALKALKTECQKTTEKYPKLNPERLKYHLRAKLSGFLKEELDIPQTDIDKEIEKYAKSINAFTKSPLRPVYISVEPVEDIIKDYLIEQGADTKRLDRLWHPAKVEHFPPSTHELPEPKLQTLKNPIVKQALYSLRSAIRTIEEKYGKPNLVRIELARELNDKNMRIAIRKWQKKKEEEADKARKELLKYPDIDVNKPENLLKYKLWKELKETNGCHIDPYQPEKTICFTDVFKNNKYQVEHIIPKSRCWTDDERNLTLCETYFNDSIKQNLTPFELKDVNEAFGKNYYAKQITDKNGKTRTFWNYTPLEGWKKKADDLTAQIEEIDEKIKKMNPGDGKDENMQKKHLLKFERDYYKGKYRRFLIENLNSELNEDDEFLNNLISDTSYITRLAALYLKSYYGNDVVETVKGATTSMLRDEWKFPEKDRSKHYHHAEDAILIAFTDRTLYQRLAEHRKKEKKSGRFLYHPWNITIENFRQQVYDAVMNIAVYDKQRNKTITKYKKQIHLKGGKREIEITAVRGAIHEAFPYKKLQKGSLYSQRKPFIKLSNQNWKDNIPESLKKSWQPLEEKTETKQIKAAKVAGLEKPIAFSKLQFSHLENIEDDTIREIIEARLKEKNIETLGSDAIIPKEVFSEKILIQVTSKGADEIKKCQIQEGDNKPENRKIGLGQNNALQINEIPFITDEAIKSAVIRRLIELTESPETLKEELTNEQIQEFSASVSEETFHLEMKLPDAFFEKKLKRSLNNFGIPVKKVTFINRDNKGRRVRKKIEALIYDDIPKISEPARTLIIQRLKEINAEIDEPARKLPPEFYEDMIYIPVKNVRAHYPTDLYPIRKGNYFRFGNTAKAIIYKRENQTSDDGAEIKVYAETIPFYLAINTEKYRDEITRLQFFQGFGAGENPSLSGMKKITELRNGDYFILFKPFEEIEKAISQNNFFPLRENLYKVSMISATSFDIQFRKHYAAKSDVKEENKNIKSSKAWVEANPVKVKVMPSGELKLI